MIRRFPDVVTLLRPTQVQDAYGDTVDGPLAAVGNSWRGWLQTRSSLAQTAADTGSPVVTTTTLYAPASAPALAEDDVLSVNGIRYRVDGEPRLPTNPRGRSRFREIPLKRVTRGG